jgi:hypothetical protein
LANLPVLLVLTGAWGAFLYWLLRGTRHDDRRLGPRMAYLEARLLPMEEARPQREGG